MQTCFRTWSGADPHIVSASFKAAGILPRHFKLPPELEDATGCPSVPLRPMHAAAAVPLAVPPALVVAAQPAHAAAVEDDSDRSD